MLKGKGGSIYNEWKHRGNYREKTCNDKDGMGWESRQLAEHSGELMDRIVTLYSGEWCDRDGLDSRTFPQAFCRDGLKILQAHAQVHCSAVLNNYFVF